MGLIYLENTSHAWKIIKQYCWESEINSQMRMFNWIFEWIKEKNQIGSEGKIYISAQCTIYVNRLKKALMGGSNTRPRETVWIESSHMRWFSGQSYKMVLRTVILEAGPRERRPKALKTKLAQKGPSDLSPLRSDGSQGGQAGGWTTLMVAKDAQKESWKTTLGSKQAYWQPK
jgi:hypothetical protein